MDISSKKNTCVLKTDRELDNNEKVIITRKLCHLLHTMKTKTGYVFGNVVNSHLSTDDRSEPCRDFDFKIQFQFERRTERFSLLLCALCWFSLLKHKIIVTLYFNHLSRPPLSPLFAPKPNTHAKAVAYLFLFY